MIVEALTTQVSNGHPNGVTGGVLVSYRQQAADGIVAIPKYFIRIASSWIWALQEPIGYAHGPGFPT